MSSLDKTIERKLEQSLDINSNDGQQEIVTIDQSNSIIHELKTVKEQSETDFDYARENFYDIIEKGRDAMEELLEIAKADESPRAFEVLSQLFKNMSETNEKLLDLHLKKKKIDDESEDKSARPQNVTNALFVGSTAELLKMIKQETKKNV